MKYLLISLLIALVFGAYSNKNALDLAYFSKIAYESLASINAWNCGGGCSRFKMTDVKAFSNSTLEMQGYVGYSTTHSAVIVAFRGSANIKNWINNFDAAQISYSKCSGCVVHRGFYNGYNTISATVKSQIQLIISKYRNAPIYVTGHSLGGALAVVAGLDLHSTFSNVNKLYTFGQPRVGNLALANYIGAQFPDAYRVIHYADIVVHVPPQNLNYNHHNHQIWYQQDMKTYKSCTAQDKSCANSVPVTQFSTGDHDISNYIKIVAINNLRRIFDMAIDAAISLI